MDLILEIGIYVMVGLVSSFISIYLYIEVKNRNCRDLGILYSEFSAITIVDVWFRIIAHDIRR